jgi:tetratricopeptide (TPR) repeat protein
MRLVFHKQIAAVAAVAAAAAISALVTGCSTVNSADLSTLPTETIPQATQAQRDLLQDVPDASNLLVKGRISGAIVAVDSGPGLLIGSPTGTGVPDSVQSFGDACSAWLQVVAAGQPGLDRTPSQSDLARAEFELPSPALRITMDDLPRLPLMLGVTHAAVAGMSGSDDSYTLTYQVYTAKSGMPVGSPILLTGTEDEIVQKLPSAAAQIDHDLGIANPNVPTSVQCTPDDMSFLGRTWWAPAISDADKAQLAQMASHSGLAAFMNLGWQTFYAPRESQGAVDAALAAFPENPVVYGLASFDYPAAIFKHQANLFRDFFAHPTNYLYASALANMSDTQKGSEAPAVDEGIRGVSDDPDNPGAWCLLGGLYSDQAEAVRHARFSTELTPAQQTAIAAPYSYCLGCDEHAARLDPSDYRAWTWVSESASFGGSETEADAAIRHALHIGRDPYYAYDWALQLYQPKWTDQEDKLTAAVTLAANDRALSAGEEIGLSENLAQSTYPALRRMLLDAGKTRAAAEIAANPKDAAAYETLGDYYNKSNDKADAQTQYAAAVSIEQQNPKYQETLGGVMYDQGFNGRALKSYQAAAAIEPAYPNIHYDIGLVYKRFGKYDLAFAQMRQELALYPESALAYDGLGDVYIETHQPAKAAAAYLAYCRISPFNPDEWVNAANMFDTAGDIKDSLSTIAEGQTYWPDEVNMTITKQDCYLKLHKPEVTIQICHELLASASDPVSIAYSHENMAEAYLEEHKLDQARAEWRQVLTMGNPTVAGVAQDFLQKYGS